MSEGPTLTCDECHGNGWHRLTCSAVRAALAIGVSAEERRQARHHDVLCLVLKAGVEAALAGRIDGTTQAAQLVAVARKHADLAYPPPKDEGDREP